MRGSVAGSNPMIAPDGRFLVFAGPGPGGSIDLFVSCREGDAWGAPLRLPEPVSSDSTDFAPGIAGGHLFFTSERPGIVGPRPEGVRPPGDRYRTGLDVASARCG